MDTSTLMRLIKKAAVEAVDAAKPTAIVFGDVISSSPLKIKVEQKMTLTDEQLILAKNVTDYTVNATVEWTTESITHDHSYTDDGSNMTTGSNTHNHQVQGTKSITIHNALQIGDKVLLLRMQGGQKFIVFDKLN